MSGEDAWKARQEEHTNAKQRVRATAAVLGGIGRFYIKTRPLARMGGTGTAGLNCETGPQCVHSPA